MDAIKWDGMNCKCAAPVSVKLAPIKGIVLLFWPRSLYDERSEKSYMC